METPRHLPPDSDLVRAARHLIDYHGRKAASAAERRAQNLKFEGREDAAAHWLQIARVVRAIEAGVKIRGH